jgi:hypothetical protein
MSQEWQQKIIRLPRATYAPSIADLHYILKRAKENPGVLVESAWIPPGSSKMYELTAIFKNGATVPSWRLCEAAGAESSETWQCDSYELEKVIVDIGKLSDGSEHKTAAPTTDLISQYSTGQQASVRADSASSPSSSGPAPVAAVDDFVEPESELAFLGAAAQTASHLLEQLRHPRTGFYTESAFMQFLEHELGRFHSFQTPCSLVIFSLATEQTATIPVNAAAVAAARLALAVDRLDVVGHFDETNYAMLLPNVERKQAALVVVKAFDLLNASPLADGICKANLKVSSGIASLPEDACDLQALIEAAQDAHEQAKQKGHMIGLAHSFEGS